MTERTSLYQAVEKLLGDGTQLSAFVAERRPAQSWRAIAAELNERTGVEISHEGLRGWFPEDAETAAA